VTISPRTLLAYRRTTYAAGTVTVRIGRRSAAMDVLLRRHGVRCGVFITAWNPYSRVMPTGWNRRIQAAFGQRLRRMVAVAGRGHWRRWHEEHVLLPGDPRPALRLARLFRQRAVVVVRRGQRAQLVVR
jgi:peptidoglycan/xylan/chitin deacetylase (PgdA/CDA1 family)